MSSQNLKVGIDFSDGSPKPEIPMPKITVTVSKPKKKAKPTKPRRNRK